ncbi:MAG TPA: hypothetical protein PK264_23380 [Hyphomicrobiaceae bacterium]|nr:hypothetical protein [Hyphomicrobiaceae bacterium]
MLPRFATVLLALLPWLLPSPAAADQPMRKPVAALVDYAQVCHAKRFAQPAVEMTPYGPRLASGAAAAPLRVVYTGFPVRTSLSPDLQEHINRIILRRLSEARMDIMDPREQAEALEAVRGSFGTNKMLEASKGMKLQSGDMLVRAEGRFIRNGQYVEVGLVLMWPDTSCKNETPTDNVEVVDDGAAVPIDVMREAIKSFTTNYKVINRIAVLPTVIGVSPLDPAIAGPLEDDLERELAKALKPAAQPGQTVIAGADDKRSAPPPVPLARMSRLSFFKEEAKEGDWLARLRVEVRASGPHLTVEFLDVMGSGSASAGRMIAPASIRSAKPAAPAIELLAEQSPLRVDLDPLRYAFKVNRPASLYCAMQDLDGETLLIYPTPDTQRNKHQPRAEAMRAPQDLDGTIAGTFGKPVRALIRCLAVPNGLTGNLERAWMLGTVRERLENKKPVKLSGAEYAKLVDALKAGAEVHETHAILTVTGTAPR